MRIISIKLLSKNKYIVKTEEGNSFTLYGKEIKKFCLTENQEISDECYYEICELLYKRAKERAFYLVEKQERTKSEIKEKLIKSGYPSEVIEKVLHLLEDYKYINDERYALQYYQQKHTVKSNNEIKCFLRRKGVSDEIIKNLFRSLDTDLEKETLQHLMTKKMSRYEKIGIQEKQKICQYFMRKGYSWSLIQECMNQCIEERE